MTDSPSPRPPGPQILAFQVPKVDSQSELRRRVGRRHWSRAMLLRGHRRPLLGVMLMVIAVSQGALITWGALVSPTDLPISTSWLPNDKLIHGLAFGWLAYWLMAGLHHVTRLPVGWTCVITIMAAGVGWGGAIELAQSFTVARHFDLMDLLANTVGAIIMTSILVVIAEPGHPRQPRYTRTEGRRG